MSKYIDFHCHSLSNETDDLVEIVSFDPRKKFMDGLFTLGFHPWWTNGLLTDGQIEILRNVFLNNKKCLAIGECGLDKLQGAEESVQITNFEKQVELANLLDAPLIIHCVRKYDTLLSIYKNQAKTPWVIHGYKRNKILAKTLLDLNIGLSVAPYEMMPDSFLDTLSFIPMDKLHLETDSDRRLNIVTRYKILAELRKISLDQLILQLFNNCKIFFGNKWPI
ncbi:MAG TPA: TatD family hydrolase [Saprospiraceae bacterium]|nr:TatD family hydrolase [Saprospiraceae bacterium]